MKHVKAIRKGDGYWYILVVETGGISNVRHMTKDSAEQSIDRMVENFPNAWAKVS